MAIHFNTEDRGDYLQIRSCGTEEHLEQSIAYNKAMYDAVLESKRTKVLLDERQLTNLEDIFDVYSLAETHEALHFARNIEKVAIVGNPKDRSNLEFFEILSRNRGFQVKIFYEPEPAEAWLQESR